MSRSRGRCWSGFFAARPGRTPPHLRPRGEQGRTGRGGGRRGSSGTVAWFPERQCDGAEQLEDDHAEQPHRQTAKEGTDEAARRAADPVGQAARSTDGPPESAVEQQGDEQVVGRSGP